MKFVVVGAGISGLTAAAILKRAGHTVIVFDTREEIGGNCTDVECDHGGRAHKYGPHIFHTDNQSVWDFINQFTKFNGYQHKVLASTPEGTIPIPFNDISAGIVGHKTGEEIRDLLFVDYSAKMWGIPWKNLPIEIRSRVPQKRDGTDCRYFGDDLQGIPVDGYQPMFEAMAEHCELRLGSDPNAWMRENADHVIYTGPLDTYFDYAHGRLTYRTLDIEFRAKEKGESYYAAVINQCNKLPCTRIADHSYWHDIPRTGEVTGLVSTEFPREWTEDDVPYYPKPYGVSMHIAEKYRELQNYEYNTTFLGRLATYQYLNMDQAIAQAIEAMDVFDT